MICYDMKKWLEKKKLKVSDIHFIPNATRGNGLMMVTPTGEIYDCEACCEKVEEQNP